MIEEESVSEQWSTTNQDIGTTCIHKLSSGINTSESVGHSEGSLCTYSVLTDYTSTTNTNCIPCLFDYFRTLRGYYSRLGDISDSGHVMR